MNLDKEYNCISRSDSTEAVAWNIWFTNIRYSLGPFGCTVAAGHIRCNCPPINIWWCDKISNLFLECGCASINMTAFMKLFYSVVSVLLRVTNTADYSWNHVTGVHFHYFPYFTCLIQTSTGHLFILHSFSSFSSCSEKNSLPVFFICTKLRL